MKRLPNSVKSKISPNLTVVYWTRRVVFEVVPEVSESLFNGWVTFIIGRAIEPGVAFFANNLTGAYDQNAYWILLGLIILMASHRGIHELFLWYNEIYIVCIDQQNGGGRVYKFWNWPIQVHVSGAITASWPVVVVNATENRINLIFYDIWGRITGERMAKLSMYVAELTKQPLLEGKRIPPVLETVIDRVRGSKPKQSSGGNAGLDAVYPLSHALWTGLTTEDQARNAFTAIVGRAVHQGEIQ